MKSGWVCVKEFWVLSIRIEINELITITLEGGGASFEQFAWKVHFSFFLYCKKFWFFVLWSVNNFRTRLILHFNLFPRASTTTMIRPTVSLILIRVILIWATDQTFLTTRKSVLIQTVSAFKFLWTCAEIIIFFLLCGTPYQLEKLP